MKAVRFGFEIDAGRDTVKRNWGRMADGMFIRGLLWSYGCQERDGGRMAAL